MTKYLNLTDREKALIVFITLQNTCYIIHNLVEQYNMTISGDKDNFAKDWFKEHMFHMLLQSKTRLEVYSKEMDGQELDEQIAYDVSVFNDIPKVEALNDLILGEVVKPTNLTYLELMPS